MMARQSEGLSFYRMRSLFLVLPQMTLMLWPGIVSTAKAQGPSSARELLKLGIEHYRVGDLETAIANFTEAIRKNSGLAESSQRRKILSSTDDQPSGLVEDNPIVVADEFNALAYYNRGMAWSSKGDVDRAIHDFDTAIRINPRYVDAYIIRGKAWQSKGKFDLAIADYDRAIVLDPRSTFAYNNRGIARKEMQDVGGAIADFTRVIMLNPRLVQAYINRGAARCRIGDLTGATADLNKAIELDSYNSMAYNNRGNTRQTAGDLNGAIEDYNRAIQLDSEDPFAFMNRGLTYLELGKKAQAEADFKRALALDSTLRPDIEQLLGAVKRPPREH